MLAQTILFKIIKLCDWYLYGREQFSTTWMNLIFNSWKENDAKAEDAGWPILVLYLTKAVLTLVHQSLS